MSDSITVAIITGGLLLVGTVITAVLQFLSTRKKISEEFTKQTAELSKQSEVADLKLQAKLENFQAVTNEKIDELSKRVEKHNNVVERMYRLEENTSVMAEKLRNLENSNAH